MTSKVEGIGVIGERLASQIWSGGLRRWSSLVGITTRKQFILLISILALSISGGSGQTYPECYPEYYGDGPSDCVASDLKTSYVYMADYYGEPLESCTADEKVDIYIWFGFETTATRYWVHVVYDLYTVNEDGEEPVETYIGRYWNCVGTVISDGPDRRLNDEPYEVNCGDTVVLKNVVTDWMQPGSTPNDCNTPPNCEDMGNPKCRQEGTITAHPQPPGTISGFKWNDTDRDGVWDPGELPLEGWTIKCTNTSTSEEFTNETDENGYYIFEDLSFDTYEISENVEDGWGQTHPSSPAYYTVTITDDHRLEYNLNFGNARCQEVFAGDDQIVCAGDEVTLEGDANYYDLVGWSSELCGDHLDYPISGESELIARYYPPVTGEPDGLCNFTLCAEGACGESCDNVTVYVVDLPNAEIRDMGDS
jgi:hypothetical protein